MRRALVIGIDDYSSSPLNGCVNDAISVGALLEKNGDGSPNFSVQLMTSDSAATNNVEVGEAIKALFTGDAETAVLYFAGHGVIDDKTNAGYICGSDAKKGSLGVSLSDVISQANKAYPKIRSTVIILDSCQSGFAGEVQTLNDPSMAAIGTGVTILTACHREGVAAEGASHGLFTELFIDGLSGSSSDICGRITPAALYSHIDQTLGPWEQRPIYKANVQTFVTLRQVSPKVPLDVLRRLPTYFPDAAYTFPLDPSFEPDRENVPEAMRGLPRNADNERVFKELQLMNRHGLVVPVDTEHMYYAAINSTGCRLTALGSHFRTLAEMGRL